MSSGLPSERHRSDVGRRHRDSMVEDPLRRLPFVLAVCRLLPVLAWVKGHAHITDSLTCQIHAKDFQVHQDQVIAFMIVILMLVLGSNYHYHSQPLELSVSASVQDPGVAPTRSARDESACSQAFPICYSQHLL